MKRDFISIPDINEAEFWQILKLAELMQQLNVIGLQPDKQRMLEVAGMNFSVAPDVAIQLAVKTGMSFREAYKRVKLMIGKGNQLNLSPKQRLHDMMDLKRGDE